MDAGLAAVLGVAAGALAAVAAAGITSLGARWQTRLLSAVERERWLLQARRDAYGSLLAQYDELQMSWWRLAQQLDRPDRDPRRCDELFRTVTDLWSPFMAASAVVQILGPAPVAAVARDLQAAAHRYDDDGTAWYRAVSAGGPPRTRASYHLAHSQAEAHVSTLLERCRAALAAPMTYGGEGEPPLAVVRRRPHRSAAPDRDAGPVAS